MYAEPRGSSDSIAFCAHSSPTHWLTGFEFWPNIGLNNNSCHHSCQSWWWGASKKVVKLGSNGGFQISILKTTRNVNFEKVLHWCRDPVQMLSCLLNPHSSLSSPSADQTLTFSTALQDTASQKCIFSFIPVLTVCWTDFQHGSQQVKQDMPGQSFGKN